MLIYIFDQNYKWFCMFYTTGESLANNTPIILKIQKGSTLFRKNAS